MLSLRRLCVVVALSVCLLPMVGCSCKRQEPTPARVVVVKEPPAPPAQQAQGGERAQPPAGPPPDQREPVLEGGGVPSLLTAPLEYTHAVTIRAPRYARRTVNLAYIQNEIKQFHAAEGRYPQSLAELEQWLGEPIGEPGPGYVFKYDPQTGSLQVVPAE